MSETIDFGKEKISTLFRKLFYPTLLGMLSVSAVTAIDGVFVGHGVGSDGIAAINICVPLMVSLTGVGLMAGMGCSVVASVYMSHGKPALARASITQALVFVTLIALLVVIPIMIAPEKAARLLGSSDHLLPSVTTYLLWFAPSLITQLWLAVAMFALRLDGVPKLGMWCSVVSAVINVVLDWLFIFPLGWGLMGAAFASAISIVVGAVIAMVYLLFFARSMRLHPLRIDRRGVEFFFINIGHQCRIGSSAMLGEATLATLMYVGNLVFMRQLGDDGVGAFGVCCYYLPFVFMTGNAIAQSAQPIISYNYGLGDGKRIREALRVSVLTALTYGLFTTVAFVFLPDILVGMFLNLDNAAAQIALEGLPYCGVGFVFFIINLAVIGYFQSVEKIIPATMFALCRGLVFLVPFFLVLPEIYGTAGIWLALPFSELLTTLAIVITMSVSHRTELIGRR